MNTIQPRLHAEPPLTAVAPQEARPAGGTPAPVPPAILRLQADYRTLKAMMRDLLADGITPVSDLVCYIKIEDFGAVFVQACREVHDTPSGTAERDNGVLFLRRSLDNIHLLGLASGHPSIEGFCVAHLQLLLQDALWHDPFVLPDVFLPDDQAEPPSELLVALEQSAAPHLTTSRTASTAMSTGITSAAACRHEPPRGALRCLRCSCSP